MLLETKLGSGLAGGALVWAACAWEGRMEREGVGTGGKISRKTDLLQRGDVLTARAASWERHQPSHRARPPPAVLGARWDAHRGTHGMQKKGICPQIALSHPWFPEIEINQCAEGQVSCGVNWGALPPWSALGDGGGSVRSALPLPGSPCSCPLAVCSCTEPALFGQVEENLFSSLLKNKNKF